MPNVRITDPVDLVTTVELVSTGMRVDFYLDDVRPGVDNADLRVLSFSIAVVDPCCGVLLPISCFAINVDMTAH